MEFLEKIFEYEHFSLILFSVIGVLVFLFILVLVLGKRDAKKRVTQEELADTVTIPPVEVEPVAQTEISQPEVQVAPEVQESVKTEEVSSTNLDSGLGTTPTFDSQQETVNDMEVKVEEPTAVANDFESFAASLGPVDQSPIVPTVPEEVQAVEVPLAPSSVQMPVEAYPKVEPVAKAPEQFSSVYVEQPAAPAPVEMPMPAPLPGVEQPTMSVADQLPQMQNNSVAATPTLESGSSQPELPKAETNNLFSGLEPETYDIKE